MFVAGRRPSCPYFELQLPESSIKEAYVPLRCVLISLPVVLEKCGKYLKSD